MRYLQGVYILWYRDILRFWRDKIRIVGALVFPLLFLVVFGAGLRGNMGMLAPGVDYTRFIFQGIIAMTVLMTSFMSGLSIAWDREFGFLKEVLVAPVSRGAVAVGKTLGGATIALAQGSLVLLLAPLIGVSLSPLMVLTLLPVMFVVAMSLSALGILIASRMNSLEAFQAITQMLLFPMVFFSGVFFPLANLPAWLGALVRINPVTYGVDALRQLFLSSLELAVPEESALVDLRASLFGQPLSVTQDLALVSLFGVVVMGLAVWSFRRQG